MRCEQCKHCKKETLNEHRNPIGMVMSYDEKYICGASKTGKRKIAVVHHGVCSYRHKIIYQPRWCPLTVKKDSS